MKLLLCAILLAGCGAAQGPAQPTATTPAPDQTATASPPTRVACGPNSCRADEFCVELTACGHGQPPPPGQSYPAQTSQFECRPSAPRMTNGDTGFPCSAPDGHKVVCACPPVPSAPPQRLR